MNGSSSEGDGLMPLLLYGLFGGENRKKSPYHLTGAEAVTAENIDFTTGKATPLRAPSFVRTAQADTAALAVLNDNLVELPHAAATALVAAGAENERLIVTSAAFEPYVLRRAGGQVERLPLSVRINLAMAATAAAEGNADQGATALTQTFALALQRQFDGAESELCAPVDVSVAAGQEVRLTIPAGLVRAPQEGEYPAGTVTATGLDVLVYRSITGGYKLVGRFAYNNAAQQVRMFDFDAAAGVDAQFVGEVTKARGEMQGVGIHPKGFGYGFAGNRICLSAVEQFGRWPRSYEVVIPEAVIEAMVEWNGDLFVFPRGHAPRVVRLDSPRNPFLPVPSESNFPCVAGGSVVNMGRLGVWYAAREGVATVPSGELLTRDILSERGERAFRPPSMAFKWRDDYLMPQAEGVEYITPRAVAGGVQLGTATVRGVRSAVSVNGVMHVLAEGGIYQWGTGNAMTVRWKGGRTKLVDLTDVPAAYVVAGGVEEHRVVSPLYEGYFAPPVALGASGDLAAGGGVMAAAVAEFVQQVSGNLEVLVHRAADGDVSVERIPFPAAGAGALPAYATQNEFDDEQVDALVHLADVNVTSWFQVEVESEREVLFLGVLSQWDDLARIRDEQDILSNTGFRG